MSLKLKILSGIVTMLIVLFGSVGVVNWRAIQTIKGFLEASVEREGNSLVTATSEAMALSLPSRDYALVKLSGQRLVEGRPHLTRLLIFDEDGGLVFRYPDNDAAPQDPLDPGLAETLKTERAILVKDAGSHYEFVGALKTVELGTDDEYVFGFVTMWLYKAYVDQEVNTWLKSQFLICAAIMIASLALFYLFIVRTITNPIRWVVRFIQRVSAGDFSESSEIHNVNRHASRKDEIGMMSRSVIALNSMVKRLNQVVMNVEQTGNHLTARSQVMSQNAKAMAQGVSEQASATEGASSAMEQMVANIRQNAENARQTETIAVKAAEDAQASGRAVGEVVTAMQEIEQRVALVDDIARQTRMLSLNATIEAARAQEHGRGFAVVAAEVRRLAEQVQTASAEINMLVSVNVAVAKKAGDMLATLIPDIQKTAELVQEISVASREQSTGVTQINRAIQQLDTITQQNSAASEELSATAAELAGQAEVLQQTIAFFSVDRDDQSGDDNQKQPTIIKKRKRMQEREQQLTDLRGHSPGARQAAEAATTNPSHES